MFKKKYSADFKAKVAIEVIRGMKTQSEITSEYGVHMSQIQRWKQEAIEAIKNNFNQKKQLRDKSQEALVESLYRQIGQLSVENDWLKKKSGFVD
jgi:transposase-like protein